MNDAIRSRISDDLIMRTARVERVAPPSKSAVRSTALRSLPAAPAAEREAPGDSPDRDAGYRKEQLRLLADVFPGGVAYINDDGRHAFSNSEYSQWFDAADGIEGVAMIDLFGARTYAMLRPHVAAALAGRRVVFQTTLLHAMLGHRAVRVSYVPQVDDTGEVAGFFSVMNRLAQGDQASAGDSTRRAELFQAHRVATMGDMITSLAHDLNQPLGAITSYAGGLQRMLHAGVAGDEIVPTLHKISEQARCAADIVRGVREFVDRSANHPAPVDMNLLLRKSISLTEGRARLLGAHVHLRAAQRLPRVLGEAVQLEQVLINLITNALEAMESTEQDARVLTLQSAPDGTDHVDIAVCDTGEGIPDSRLDRVFEAFHTTKRDGMGIGLSISRAIVEAHDGRLWAESRVGRGTCFHVRLPIAMPGEVDDTV